FRRSENSRRVSPTERFRRRLFIPRSHRSNALKNGGRDLWGKRPARVLVPDVSIHLRLHQLSFRTYVLCGEARFGAVWGGSLRAGLSDHPPPDGSSPAFLAGVRIDIAQPAAHSLLILRADRHSAQFPGDGQPLLRPGETLEDRSGFRRGRGLYAHRELDADRSAARVAIHVCAEGLACRLRHYDHLSAVLVLHLLEGDGKRICLLRGS